MPRRARNSILLDRHSWGWSPPHGPIVINLDQSFGHHQPFGTTRPLAISRKVIAMAEAHGANTLSATLTSALTVENQFSFVHGMAMVAALKGALNQRARSVRWHVGRLASCLEAPTPSWLR